MLNVNTIILPFAIACIIQGNVIFGNSIHSCFLEQIVISGCPAYIIALAKFFVTYLKLCITSIITLCFFFLLGNTAFETQWSILKVFFLYSVPLSSTTLLSATLTLKTESNHWLGVLISLPLILIFLMYLSPILNYHLDLNTITTSTHADLQIFTALSLISCIISICACSYLISKI